MILCRCKFAISSLLTLWKNTIHLIFIILKILLGIHCLYKRVMDLYMKYNIFLGIGICNESVIIYWFPSLFHGSWWCLYWEFYKPWHQNEKDMQARLLLSIKLLSVISEFSFHIIQRHFILWSRTVVTGAQFLSVNCLILVKYVSPSVSQNFILNMWINLKPDGLS